MRFNVRGTNHSNYWRGKLQIVMVGLLILTTIFFSTPVLAKEHINVIVIKCPNIDLTKEMLPQFEKRFGIEVTINETAFTDIHSKEMSDFVAHTANYDVVAMDETWLPEFVEGGWVECVEPYVQKTGIRFFKDYENKWPPAKTYPTIYVGDAVTPVVNLDACWKGKLYGMPGMSTGVMMLFYQKSMLEDPVEKATFQQKYGYELKVPGTWKELRDVAEFFTKPEKGLYGLSMSLGKANPAMIDYLCIAYSWGGDSFAFGQGLPDPNDPIRNMPILSSEAAVGALQYMVSLKPFMPPGVAGYEWAEVTEDFVQGKAAMMIQWSDFSPEIEEPRSKVAGNVGYALLPSNPEAIANNVPGTIPGESYTPIGSWVLMMNKDSKHKEATWKFIAWASGLTMTEEEIEQFFGAGFINMNKKGFFIPHTKGYTTGRFPLEYELYMHHLRKRPYITGGLEWEMIVGTAVQEAFIGRKTAQEALKEADVKLHTIMQRDGYIPQNQPLVWPSKYVNRDGSWAK